MFVCLYDPGANDRCILYAILCDCLVRLYVCMTPERMIGVYCMLSVLLLCSFLCLYDPGANDRCTLYAICVIALFVCMFV